LVRAAEVPTAEENWNDGPSWFRYRAYPGPRATNCTPSSLCPRFGSKLKGKLEVRAPSPERTPFPRAGKPAVPKPAKANKERPATADFRSGFKVTNGIRIGLARNLAAEVN
jgi:hypothetical protein